MIGWWNAIASVALFAAGLRLSAFFSGSEIGFYRVSPLRLSVEADSGDSISARLLRFVQQPSIFVATTLVGNNVANYITTYAIALATAMMFGSAAGAWEIVGTILFSPVIFVFGELIPKNLYYEAPHRLLRRDGRWFILFYWLFIPISFPLVGLVKLFERFGGADNHNVTSLLGRKRLVQVLTEGHEEGILTKVQNELAQGLLHNAPRRIRESMTESARVLGVPENHSSKQTLDFARRHGMALVPVRKAGGGPWFGFVSVADIAMYDRPITDLTVPLLRLEATTGKLEAILAMRESGKEYAAVCQGEKVLGLLLEGDLVEEIFISQQTVTR